MNKQSKYIMIALAISFVLVFLHLMYTGHHMSFKEPKNYLSFFKDSLVEHISTGGGDVADQDVITSFIYYENITDKTDYYKDISETNACYFRIWDLKTLSGSELNDIRIDQNPSINKLKFAWSETLDSESPVPMTFKYLYKIDGMKINLGGNSSIIKELRGKNYKGFYGLLDEISFADKKGSLQAYIKFQLQGTPTILLLCKKKGKMYMIMIHSRRNQYSINAGIDESIINVLDLEN